jgi:hypothetical protein
MHAYSKKEKESSKERLKKLTKSYKKQTYKVLDGGVTTAQNESGHSVGMAAGGRLM